MTELRSTLNHLASQFTDSIMSAVRDLSLDQLMQEAKAHGGRGGAHGGGGAKTHGGRATNKRLHRRSEDEITDLVAKMVALVGSNPEGMRAEQIREALKIEAREMGRPIAFALSTHQLKKKGYKRATTYFVGAKAKAKKS